MGDVVVLRHGGLHRSAGLRVVQGILHGSEHGVRDGLICLTSTLYCCHIPHRVVH